MILAVDTGNTHTVLGVIDENGHIVNVFRLQTKPDVCICTKCSFKQ